MIVTMWYLVIVLNVLLLEYCCGLTCPPVSDEGMSSIRKLHSSLFCNYEKEERPVQKLDQPVNVNVSLDLKHIFMIDSTNLCEVQAWLIVTWTDEFLTWDPAKYEGLAKIYVTTDQIWLPEISVFNSDLTQVEIFRSSGCMINNSGKVLCGPSLKTPVYCQHSLTRWPYDVQHCNLVIGTWGILESEVNLDLLEKGIFGDNFVPNNAWELLDWLVERKSHLNGQGLQSSYLEYSFSLKRHAAMYVVFFIAPAFVFAGLVLLSFWVRGLVCRTCMCSVALIGNAMFMQDIGAHMSASGDTSPDILAYYRDAMFLTLISLGLGILVERLRDSKSAGPDWLTRVSSWLRGPGGRAGQILLGDSEQDAEVANTANLEETRTTKPRWSSFATFLNRISFLALAITYVILLISLLP